MRISNPLKALYLKYSLIWNTLAVALAYWLVAAFVPTEAIYTITYNMAVVLIFGAWLTWTPRVIRVFKTNSTEGEDYLAFTIWLVATVFLETRIYAQIALWLEFPDWMRQTGIPGFFAYQIAIIGILLMYAVAKARMTLTQSYGRETIFMIAGGFFILGLIMNSVIASFIKST